MLQSRARRRGARWQLAGRQFAAETESAPARMYYAVPLLVARLSDQVSQGRVREF